MPLSLQCAIDLDQHRIYQWLRTTPAPANWPNPDTSKDGYTMSPGAPPKPAGTIDSVQAQPGDPTRPLCLYWSQKQSCELIEGGQVIARFDLVLPYVQEFSVTIYSVLYLQSDASGNVTVPAAARAIIENAFNNYTQDKGDPIDYMIAELQKHPEAQITSDMYSVAQTFTLNKKTDAQEYHPSSRDQLDELIAGKVAGKAWPTLGGQPIELNDYLHKRDFRYKFVGAPVDVDGILPRPIGGHEVEVPPGTNPQKAVDNIAIGDAQAAECEYYNNLSWPIVDVLSWTEFKVDWVLQSLKIGCVTVEWSVPIIRTRTAELVLYGTLTAPDLGTYMITALQDCVSKAALSSGVVALCEEDFDAASSTFMGAFQLCCEIKFQQLIDCVIPGIVLVYEVGGWSLDLRFASVPVSVAGRANSRRIKADKDRVVIADGSDSKRRPSLSAGQ